MTWAAVSWAYKDVITSAKLAQMGENLRVHDHATVDQGQRLGLLASGFVDPADFSTTATAQTAATGFTFAVTPPAGITPATRPLVLILTVAVPISTTRTDVTLKRGATTVSLNDALIAPQSNAMVAPLIGVDTGYTAGSANTYSLFVAAPAAIAHGISLFSYLALLL